MDIIIGIIVLCIFTLWLFLCLLCDKIWAAIFKKKASDKVSTIVVIVTGIISAIVVLAACLLIRVVPFPFH